MISREVVQKICEAGAQAPSGSNSQPWRFEVRGDVISVIMLPEKDHPILNVRHGGTLIACGALVENMAVAAGHFGFDVEMAWLPDRAGRPDLVAQLSFRETAARPVPDYFDAIWRRETNRKKYETAPLDADAKKIFEEIAAGFETDGASIKFIDNPDSIRVLAGAAATNEAIMFGNACLRELMFKEIVWTEAEEKKRGGGLYLKTMELAPQQQTGLKLLKTPVIGRIFVALGIPRKIAKENAEDYAACSRYGAVLCGVGPEDFLHAGRAIERMWLAATSLGLSFHLQTGVNFLWLGSQDDKNIISKSEMAMVEAAYGTIKEIFNAGGKFIPAIFRIGHGGEPSARSIKLPPEIAYLI